MKVTKKFSLRRTPVLKKAVNVKFHPLTEEELKSHLESKKIVSEYQESICYFMNTLLKVAPHFDFSYFYKNIPTVYFKKPGLFEKIYGWSASFTPRVNCIRVNSKNYLSDIYHELFHLLSSGTFKSIDCIGFHQSGFWNSKDFGVGLNEGYTDLLTNRYFGKFTNVYYIMEHYFVRFLEHIVGQKKMEILYSQSALLGLICELEQYHNREAILEFIQNLDYLSRHESKKRSKEKNRRIIISLCNFLAQSYEKKQCLRLQAGEITQKQYDRNLKQFLYQLYRGIDFLDYKYYNFIKTADINTERTKCLQRVRAA